MDTMGVRENGADLQENRQSEVQSGPEVVQALEDKRKQLEAEIAKFKEEKEREYVELEKSLLQKPQASSPEHKDESAFMNGLGSTATAHSIRRESELHGLFVPSYLPLLDSKLPSNRNRPSKGRSSSDSDAVAGGKVAASREMLHQDTSDTLSPPTPTRSSPVQDIPAESPPLLERNSPIERASVQHSSTAQRPRKALRGSSDSNVHPAKSVRFNLGSHIVVPSSSPEDDEDHDHEMKIQKAQHQSSADDTQSHLKSKSQQRRGLDVNSSVKLPVHSGDVSRGVAIDGEHQSSSQSQMSATSKAIEEVDLAKEFEADEEGIFDFDQNSPGSTVFPDDRTSEHLSTPSPAMTDVSNASSSVTDMKHSVLNGDDADPPKTSTSSDALLEKGTRAKKAELSTSSESIISPKHSKGSRYRASPTTVPKSTRSHSSSPTHTSLPGQSTHASTSTSPSPVTSLLSGSLTNHPLSTTSPITHIPHFSNRTISSSSTSRYFNSPMTTMTALEEQMSAAFAYAPDDDEFDLNSPSLSVPQEVGSPRVSGSFKERFREEMRSERVPEEGNEYDDEDG